MNQIANHLHSRFRLAPTVFITSFTFMECTNVYFIDNKKKRSPNLLIANSFLWADADRITCFRYNPAIPATRHMSQNAYECNDDLIKPGKSSYIMTSKLTSQRPSSAFQSCKIIARLVRPIDTSLGQVQFSTFSTLFPIGKAVLGLMGDVLQLALILLCWHPECLISFLLPASCNTLGCVPLLPVTFTSIIWRQELFCLPFLVAHIKVTRSQNTSLPRCSSAMEIPDFLQILQMVTSLPA